MSKVQQIIDRFYESHGPCCAGCDWWRYHNTLVGECTRSAPVAGHERLAVVGVEWTSLAVGAGHLFTMRDHYCGEFRDTQAAA